MATYLVTGGAGFIGSSIAEKLLQNGETVRVFDDFSTGRRQNLEGLTGNLELVEGTILRPGDGQAGRSWRRRHLSSGGHPLRLPLRREPGRHQ